MITITKWIKYIGESILRLATVEVAKSPATRSLFVPPMFKNQVRLRKQREQREIKGEGREEEDNKRGSNSRRGECKPIRSVGRARVAATREQAPVYNCYIQRRKELVVSGEVKVIKRREGRREKKKRQRRYISKQKKKLSWIPTPCDETKCSDIMSLRTQKATPTDRLTKRKKGGLRLKEKKDGEEAKRKNYKKKKPVAYFIAHRA